MFRRTMWIPLMFCVPAAAVLIVARAGRGPSTAPAPAPSASPLPPARAYTLRLASDWPVYAGESAACNNTGSETLEGTLTLVDGRRYTGRLARASRLGFCGAHSAAQPTPCHLELRGRDTVAAEAVAFEGRRGTELRLRWHGDPAGAAAAAVVVEGDCSDRFKGSLELMYHEAVHEVELPVGGDVIGKVGVRLGDYPWTASVDRAPVTSATHGGTARD